MNTARIKHTAALLQNGQVLAAGGVNSAGFLNSAELYDPSTKPGDVIHATMVTDDAYWLEDIGAKGNPSRSLLENRFSAK